MLRLLPLAALSACLLLPARAAAECRAVPPCPEAALQPGPARGFRHTRSKVASTLGSPHHRARDLFQAVGEPQWLSAKFTYGKTHKDIVDEDIDVWIHRGCSGSWEKLGTTRTVDDGAPAPDGNGHVDGGRAYFRMPAGKELGAGIHRARFFVAGDGSTVDAVVEILAPGARFFVSDVDGTLTSSENAEVASVLARSTSDVRRDAARVFTTLVERGYRPLYLSARGDWLTDRAHRFLNFHGFPAGAVRVTATDSGFTGDRAAEFKSRELARLAAQGLVPSFGFGNQPSDTVAYERAKIDKRFFLAETVSDARGGRRIAGYTELLPEVTKLPCM